MGTAVALHTVFEILDAFLDVLTGHIRQRVLVAAVAGVLLVVVVDMTGRARCIVVAIEQEQLRMVEYRGLPAILLVAVQAIAWAFGVDPGLGGNVARLAAIP